MTLCARHLLSALVYEADNHLEGETSVDRSNACPQPSDLRETSHPVIAGGRTRGTRMKRLGQAWRWTSPTKLAIISPSIVVALVLFAAAEACGGPSTATTAPAAVATSTPTSNITPAPTATAEPASTPNPTVVSTPTPRMHSQTTAPRAPAAPVAPAPPVAAKPPPPPPPPPPPVSAGCYPLSNSGTCYQPGEFCRNSDHGKTGRAGNGKSIICQNKNGWRWEPA
jgi:hypothetical protein